MTKIIFLINIFILSARIVYSQSFTASLDSILEKNSDQRAFLHSILSIDYPHLKVTDTEYKYKILIAQSIAYFLLFDSYDQKVFKIQILEKGLDKLKICGLQNPILEELYDNLFNMYYNYKSGEDIPPGSIKEIIKNYSLQKKEEEVMNWFYNKLWRKGCSE